MWREDILQANLSVLDAIYPALAARVRSTEPPAPDRFPIQPHPDGGWTCRDPLGRDVHGPTSPNDSIQQILSGKDLSAPGLFLVVRPGLGYLPHALYPILRKGRNAQRMYIVENRWELLRASFALMDWRDLLRSDRVILVVDDDPGKAIVNLFVTNPIGMLQDVSLLPGANMLQEDVQLLQQLATTLSEMGTRIQESTQGFLREIHQHYAVRRRDFQSAPKAKRKVLLVQPEHDYLASRMIEAFQENGWDAEQHLINQRLSNFFNPWLWLIYVRERYPDVLFWMNRNTLSPEGSIHLRSLPITKVLWYLDNPSRVKVSKDELDATDLILSFDRGYLPHLKSLSGKPAYHLPNSPGLKIVRDLEADGPPPTRTGSEVGFVGALAADRFKAVQGFWLERKPEFVSLLNEIIEAHIQDPEPGMEQRYRNTGGLETLPYEGFVVLYLEERATYLIRKRFLESIADLGLKTFGASEWADSEIAGFLAPCYSGWAPNYEKDLAEVYFNTKINVNIFHVQCLDSTNPRIYDVLLTGSFLLTEYRPILEEEFEIGKHLDVFRTPDELREKTEYYLAHPDERETMARAGQTHVRNHYTFAHRMELVQKMIQNLEL